MSSFGLRSTILGPRDATVFVVEEFINVGAIEVQYRETV
jgi:hypothetical protein